MSLSGALETDLACLEGLTAGAPPESERILQGRPISAGLRCGPLMSEQEFLDGTKTKDAVVLSAFLDEDLLIHRSRLAAVLVESVDPSSHAVIMARSSGLPVVAISPGERGMLSSAHQGKSVSVDGTTGSVYRGALDNLTEQWPASVHNCLSACERASRIKVYANADLPGDVQRSRERHAAGFEPRLEHLLLSGRNLTTLQCVLFGRDAEIPLAEFVDCLASEVADLYRAAGGLPLYLRLLDPPSHEFEPRGAQLSLVAERLGISVEAVSKRAEELREINPMVGFRGARLLLARPDLLRAQVIAMVRGFTAAKNDGVEGDEILVLIPMVMDAEEAKRIRQEIIETAKAELQLTRVHVRIGAMVETPRAAMTAGKIAEHVDFIAFGTNDLTAQVFGISRGDAYKKYLDHYLSNEILESDPFEVLDDTVAELIRACVADMRKVNRAITFTICGEQAGHQKTIAFALQEGIDAVSVAIELIPKTIIRSAPRLSQEPRA